MQEAIQEVALHEATRSRYLNYALSVITSRALPDIRDGLKPVQRRILYAMFHGLRLLPDAKHRKSAAVVGEVMAKYHPHGDQSIYDALVRMAQDFSLRYPLVNGQGNFGSLDGDAAAAMRYTEAKLRHISVELCSELKKDTVEHRQNYDGTIQEPVVLPAQVPNLLINGTAGIAVGMATSVPPHNLGEVVSALIALIDNRELSVDQLVGRYIKGPDFPTGGAILNTTESLRQVYAEGHGAIDVRGTWELEQEGRKRRVVITSIPYGLNKASLIADIAEHIGKGRVPQLVDIRDESTEEVRVVLDLKHDGDPEAAMAFLCKRTGLQGRFNVNLTVLCPTDHPQVCQPRRVDVKEMLTAFLDFREEVTRRRLQFDLNELERRIHILRGFAKVFDALDEAIAIIRNSDDKAAARVALMARFELDEVQADAILEIRLYKLARLEIAAILEELEEKEALASEIRAILGSEEKLWSLIKDELKGIRDAYRDPRRSKRTGPVELESFSEEVYIVPEDCFVMVTREGWFKRQKSYTDLSAVRVREGDEIGWVIPASTRESLVILTDRGRAFTLRVADVPATTGHGEPLQARFDFTDDEHIVGAIGTDPRVLPQVAPEVLEALEPGTPAPPYFCALTRGGKSIRFSVDPYREPSTVSGRRFMRLDPAVKDDAVVGVVVSDGSETVSLATRAGRVLLFPVSEVNVLGGPGKGVMAIKLTKGDFVMGFSLTTERMEGLTVETSRGRVEVLRPNKYGVTHRAGRGRDLIRVGYIARVHREAVELRFPEPEPGADPAPAGRPEPEPAAKPKPGAEDEPELVPVSDLEVVSESGSRSVSEAKPEPDAGPHLALVPDPLDEDDPEQGELF